jgi:hypothetical protein
MSECVTGFFENAFASALGTLISTFIVTVISYFAKKRIFSFVANSFSYAINHKLAVIPTRMKDNIMRDSEFRDHDGNIHRFDEFSNMTGMNCPEIILDKEHYQYQWNAHNDSSLGSGWTNVKPDDLGGWFRNWPSASNNEIKFNELILMKKSK